VENSVENPGESLWKTLPSLWKSLVENLTPELSTGVVHSLSRLFHSFSTADSTALCPFPSGKIDFSTGKPGPYNYYYLKYIFMSSSCCRRGG